MRSAARSLSLIAALALISLPTTAVAQEFRGPTELRGFDFRPNGAWRKQANAVRAGRRAALARGDLRLLNSSTSSASVTGDYKLPVVFVEFSDTVASGFQLDTAAYGRLLFGTDPNADSRPYSVKTFYEELSNGNITIDGDLLGWVRTPYTKAFVGQNCYSIGAGGTTCANSLGNRLGAMMVAALDSLNSAAEQVDWSLYDSDNDGYVDFVTFIHPTIGGECIGSTVNDIWAHRFYLSHPGMRGTPYVTKTSWPGHPGQFIRIDDYIIQSSRGGNGGCTTTEIMPIGTIAHETGHAFGLPDLYNTAGSDEGIGEWGLMSSGNYARPYSPSAMEGWSLAELGWVSVAAPSTGSVTFGPVQTGDSVLRVPFSGTDEFLILENRQSLQSDTAQMNPGLATPPGKSPGLLIWHVDQSIVDGGRSSNTVNAGVNKGLRLVQADGLANLQQSGAGGNRGDRGDPFPGSSNITSANATTNPALRSSNGRVARSITAITQDSPNGPMSFTLSPSQFKVQVTVAGTGTVSSSGGGTLSTGVFTDSATTTTLTAHPTGDGVFTGWSGDTTGTDTVMVLPVRRSYTLVATFTGAVAVSYDQATDAILGITPLTTPQATYLDDVGNNNGVYDLGDYLAYLKANAIVPAPGVLRRISGARALAPTKEQ